MSFGCTDIYEAILLRQEARRSAAPYCQYCERDPVVHRESTAYALERGAGKEGVRVYEEHGAKDDVHVVYDGKDMHAPWYVGEEEMLKRSFHGDV